MAMQTLTQMRATLTKKCVEARKELFDTKRIVEAEIKKAPKIPSRKRKAPSLMRCRQHHGRRDILKVGRKTLLIYSH